jgi:hypothetical protein
LVSVEVAMMASIPHSKRMLFCVSRQAVACLG